MSFLFDFVCGVVGTGKVNYVFVNRQVADCIADAYDELWLGVEKFQHVLDCLAFVHVCHGNIQIVMAGLDYQRR